MTATGDVHAEFLAASRQALRQSPGPEALAALGFTDLLAELADPAARAAMAALFRAQGRELAATGALGALVAQPYLEACGAAPGQTVAALTRRSRRGTVDLVVGDASFDHVLVDRPGQGAAIHARAQVELRPIDVPGRLPLHELTVARAHAGATIADAVAAPARRRATSLGRIACAFEILGAAEAALALALEHAAARVQFGQPIGAFQAVRHLLAWARTDGAAIEAVGFTVVERADPGADRHDAVLKALAGRNGRRLCERTLQVLGATGFTDEHDHHHCHSRVLALDAVLGSSAALTADLGRWLREDGARPAFPTTTLLGAGAGRPTGAGGRP